MLRRHALTTSTASVERPFPLSVSACVLGLDTDASRPGRSCNSTPGLADQKDTDRLMNIVHGRTDGAPPRSSVCPACGLTADNGVPRRDDRINTVTYCDVAGHLWSVTWLEVA